MGANKKKRSDLQCPPWLKAEWEKGTEQKENMAACLQAVNWDKVGWLYISHVRLSYYSLYVYIIRQTYLRFTI
jgi:hypothetical protein